MKWTMNRDVSAQSRGYWVMKHYETSYCVTDKHTRQSNHIDHKAETTLKSSRYRQNQPDDISIPDTAEHGTTTIHRRPKWSIGIEIRLLRNFPILGKQRIPDMVDCFDRCHLCIGCWSRTPWTRRLGDIIGPLLGTLIRILRSCLWYHHQQQADRGFEQSKRIGDGSFVARTNHVVRWESNHRVIQRK